MNVPRAKAPENLQVDDRVMLSNGLPARVTGITEEGVTLDLNHELAGKHLTFDVKLVSLTPADSLRKITFGAGCFWVRSMLQCMLKPCPTAPACHC